MKAIHSVLIVGGGTNAVQSRDELDAAIYELTAGLKKKGIRVVLIDDNPFSFSSDSQFIDRSVVKSLTVTNLIELIKEEHPDAILPTVGNKLSFALVQEVIETGIVQERNIKILGAPEATVRQVNNPTLLSSTLHQMGAPTKKLVNVDNFQDAINVADEIGYPVVVVAMMAGVSYRRIAHNQDELNRAVTPGLQRSHSNQVVISQSLAGYKEIEAIVIRDASGTMMLLSMLEDINPIGIHAGDSAVVNPAQTLRDREVQTMRNIAFAITRKLRIVGVNHVQFAFDVAHEQAYVIKIRPCFDQSVLFAERSTGYPIGTVCARLYAGDTLRNIQLGAQYEQHAALIEPAMDHIAIRLPFWDLAHIPESDVELGTQKRSIGAVVGIGRNFNAALIKAIEASENKQVLTQLLTLSSLSDDQLAAKLVHPHADFIFVLFEAIRRGYSITELAEMTKVDRYYIARFQQLVKIIKDVSQHPDDPAAMIKAKRVGICDWLIGQLWHEPEISVLHLRRQQKLARTYKEVEPSAGEFDQHSGLFYSSFEVENEADGVDSPSAVVVGTGPLTLGNGAASDYCTAGMIVALRQAGFRTTVIDNNPSSVALSPLLADRRYIEPLTIGDVVDIVRLEHPQIITIPTAQQELVKLLQAENGDCQIITLPNDTMPVDVCADEQMISVDFIFDGTNTYPIAYLEALANPKRKQLKFQNTDLRFPAQISASDRQRVNQLGRASATKLTKPGLYQLWCLRQQGRLAPFKLQLLPLTEQAFLTKVLGVNLAGINLALALNTFQANSMPRWLNDDENHDYAVYHARYPFRDLHLIGEEPTTTKAIGGWIEIHRH